MDFQNKIKECTEKIFQAAKKADEDPIRPEYHFHSPAQWMDDPNGVIWHKGYYHMMYSLNPDTDKYRAGMVYKTGSTLWSPSEADWTGGITVWGHARSKDLIHWEHLPVALYPDTENSEYYIWFGCTVINDEGVPAAIYTSIGYEDRNPADSALQFIAFGDDDLITWRQDRAVNPVMTEELHHGEKVWEWRDPFVFRQNGKAFMILGGKEDKKQGGNAAVFLYEAANKAFTKWVYKGVLFEYPDPELRSCECPNIVNLGDKWVLFVSPYGCQVEYFAGELDAENCRFEWNNHGTVDYSTHFYATNVIEDGKGRNLLWGAVEGFQNTSGWNGVNSLPREISLNNEGKLVQKIPEELKMLRGEHYSLRGKETAVTRTGCIELCVRCEAGKTGEIRIGDTVISIGKENIIIEENSIDRKEAEQCEMNIFLDKSMMEVFINETGCFTAMVPPVTGECEIQLMGESFDAEIWQLNTENLFSKYE